MSLLIIFFWLSRVFFFGVANGGSVLVVVATGVLDIDMYNMIPIVTIVLEPRP